MAERFGEDFFGDIFELPERRFRESEDEYCRRLSAALSGQVLYFFGLSGLSARNCYVHDDEACRRVALALPPEANIVTYKEGGPMEVSEGQAYFTCIW